MCRMLFTCALFLCAAMACAQEPTPCTHQQTVVTVVDRNGNPLAGLTSSNFRAEFRGKSVKLSATEKTNWPAIVLLLDASRSMTGDTKDRAKWIVSVSAAAAVVNATPAEAPISLVIYASKVMKLTQGRAQVLELLEALKKRVPNLKSSEGKTATYDAILEILAKMEQDSSDKVMYLVTDGGVSVHPDWLNRVRRALAESRVRLFAFIPADDQVLRTPEEKDAVDEFSAFPPSTGGTAEVLPAIRWTDAESSLVARQVAQISHFYKLDIDLPEAPTKPHGWKLEVVDQEGKRRGDVKVSYPRELLPCTGN